MNELVADGLPAALTGVVLALLVRSVRRAAGLLPGGGAVAAYGWLLKAVPVVLGLLAVGLVPKVVADWPPPADHPADVLTGLVVFPTLVVVMGLEFFGVRVAFDAAGLQTRSPWRRPRVIPWDAVRTVTYSPALQWHVVGTDGYGKVRLHDFLGGKAALLAELDRRRGPAAAP